MPRDTVLSKEEGKIDAFRECGVGARETTRRMKRSDTVTRNYLKLGHHYAKRMKTNGNLKIIGRTIRKIKEEAT